MVDTSFYTYKETLRAQRQGQPQSLSAIPSPTALLQCPYRLITNLAELEIAITPFLAAKILAIDTETTGIDPQLHQLRLIQIAAKGQPVVLIDCFQIDLIRSDPLKQLLQNSALKILHNAKFDWQFLTEVGLSLVGPFFDTQLAYKVWVSGIKTSSSLKAIAQKLLGVSLDKSKQQSDFSRLELSLEQLQYAAIDAAILLPLGQILAQKLKQANLWKISQLECQAMPAFAQMELAGVQLDQTQWQVLEKELSGQQTGLCATLTRHLGIESSQPLQQVNLFGGSHVTSCSDFNPNSSQQVKAALGNKGITLKSTNAAHLAPLVDRHPAIATLLAYRSVTKLLTSFIHPLTQQVHPVTGRLHPTYFQLGTRSGRASCKSPPLQTIPHRCDIRHCFVVAPGNVMVRGDYSQMELRLVAKISGDLRMQQAFEQGEDLHCLTAAFLLHKPIKAVTDGERRLGKVINFGLIYGMGAKKLQSTALVKYGVTMNLAEAKTFSRQFFQLYPGIRQWHERVKRAIYIRKQRIWYTLAGRRRVWLKDGKLDPNEILNYPVQGTNADIIKLAIATLHPLLPIGAVFIGMVHDELLIECPVEMGQAVARLLEQAMLNAAQPILAPIPVGVDVRLAFSWGG
ncbi:MAG: DNA polymerase [Leptolyngbyaceae cyanobacterium bins.302]|nr:DNA polymerase [Leptolyngbyaceae cyanobacterium bins.302]